MTMPCQTMLRIIAACLSLVGSMGCMPIETPTLCVFGSPDFVGANEKATADTFTCPTPADVAKWDSPSVQCNATIADDGVLYVRHTLPEEVIASGALQLGLATPCGSTSLEIAYVDGLALWFGTPPVGATCSLTVTALLDNSELGCSFRAVDAAACINVCPEPP